MVVAPKVNVAFVLVVSKICSSSVSNSVITILLGFKFSIVIVPFLSVTKSPMFSPVSYFTLNFIFSNLSPVFSSVFTIFKVALLDAIFRLVLADVLS